MDATHRAGETEWAPHWLRDTVPLHWARGPDKCAVRVRGLRSLTGLLLCYPGGGAITLATGVNLNLETNHQELGDGDVIGVQMG